MILIINLSDINIYVYCFFKLNFMRFSWSYSLHYFNAVIMLLCLAIYFKIQTYFCSSNRLEYKHYVLYIYIYIYIVANFKIYRHNMSNTNFWISGNHSYPVNLKFAVYFSCLVIRKRICMYYIFLQLQITIFFCKNRSNGKHQSKKVIHLFDNFKSSSVCFRGNICSLMKQCCLKHAPYLQAIGYWERALFFFPFRSKTVWCFASFPRTVWNSPYSFVY